MSVHKRITCSENVFPKMTVRIQFPYEFYYVLIAVPNAFPCLFKYIFIDAGAGFINVLAMVIPLETTVTS